MGQEPADDLETRVLPVVSAVDGHAVASKPAERDRGGPEPDAIGGRLRSGCLAGLVSAIVPAGLAFIYLPRANGSPALRLPRVISSTRAERLRRGPASARMPQARSKAAPESVRETGPSGEPGVKAAIVSDRPVPGGNPR